MRCLGDALIANRGNMSKKDKKRYDPLLSKGQSNAESLRAPSAISRRGWKVIGVGLLVAAVGYIVLSFTDSRGQNLASSLSPFLIIGGYAIIGFGIIAKDPLS